MALIRDTHNVAAALRTAGAMKDRRAPRGGARNLQAQYLEEAHEVAGIEDETAAEVCLAGGPCSACDGPDLEDLEHLSPAVQVELA